MKHDALSRKRFVDSRDDKSLFCVRIIEASEFIRRALAGELFSLGKRGEPDLLGLHEVERRRKSQTCKILRPVSAASLEKLQQGER
jgi:hypothetical protein